MTAVFAYQMKILDSYLSAKVNSMLVDLRNLLNLSTQILDSRDLIWYFIQLT